MAGRAVLPGVVRAQTEKLRAPSARPRMSRWRLPGSGATLRDYAPFPARAKSNLTANGPGRSGRDQLSADSLQLVPQVLAVTRAAWSWAVQDGSVVVPAAADRVAGHPEQRQDRAGDNEDDADRPDDGDPRDEADDEEYHAENDSASPEGNHRHGQPDAPGGTQGWRSRPRMIRERLTGGPGPPARARHWRAQIACGSCGAALSRKERVFSPVPATPRAVPYAPHGRERRAVTSVFGQADAEGDDEHRQRQRRGRLDCHEQLRACRQGHGVGGAER